MKVITFIFLLLPIYLFSQELVLDDLLKEYEDSESLYKKTKQESAGFLLVYSREDLEKMQAYSLEDVLKTVRLYTMGLHSIGVAKLQKVGQGKSALPPIKVYIDDYEVTTVVQGNALDMYGDMDLYFVDHIEIYQGGSSIAFGNSPGSMVIRLYSKDPAKENSRSAQLSIDSEKGGDIRAVEAGVMGDYKYLIYADAAKINYDKQSRNNQELSRDATRYQAHFKVSQDDNFEAAVDIIANRVDIFNGMGTAPIGDGSQRDYAYLDIRKFFDGDIVLSASASIEIKKFFNSDVIGIKQPDTTFANDINVDLKSNTYKLKLDKKIVSGKHDFLIGTQFQQNNLNVKTYEGMNVNPTIGPTKLNMYMFYLEELYNINENNLLAFSGKLDYYKDSFDKDSTEYAIRLGYIALLNDEWSTKIFALRRYVYPNMLETTFAPPTYKPNPDIDSSHVDQLSGELQYDDNRHKVIFGYAYNTIEDGIGFDKKLKQYVNLEDTVYFNRIYIRGEHKFDYDNRVVVEYYKGYKDSYASPGAGALIQLFNKIDKFDIYNELVYRDGYSINYGAGDVKIERGYDYTLSVAYPITKKFKLKAKGENLLDRASATLIDAQGDLIVPVTQRRVIITGEYTF